jgi:hypothetical protein
MWAECRFFNVLTGDTCSHHCALTANYTSLLLIMKLICFNVKRAGDSKVCTICEQWSPISGSLHVECNSSENFTGSITISHTGWYVTCELPNMDLPSICPTLSSPYQLMQFAIQLPPTFQQIINWHSVFLYRTTFFLIETHEYITWRPRRRWSYNIKIRK